MQMANQERRYKNTSMRFNKHIILLAAIVFFCGCGIKKKAVPPAPQEPAWHTCLIQGARATVTTSEERLSANVTMQTVHDSMLVISVMPILGMEMMRIEATPIEITAIDKMHTRYAKATYAELNRQLTPDLNWDILQQLCAAELPTGNEKARLVFSFGEQTIDLEIDYPARQLDVPVRVNNLRLNKYTEVDISRWL